MIPDLRAGFLLAGSLCALAALGLAGDGFYAFRTRRRAARRTRRASTEPFTLQPNGTPALLLVHGFADGPSVFARLAPLLAASGFCVRALHLPGTGIPPAQMAGITLPAWREALDREIGALRSANPARPVWLVGHSLGATLAFDAALRPANSIAGLVLLAPLIEPSNARSPLLTSRQWFTLLNRLLLFSRIVESRLPADLRDPAARAAYTTDKFVHRDIYRALFAAIDFVRPRASDWHGPLFVALSPSDQIVDPSATRSFFARASAARPARLLEQPEAGHVLPLDFGHPALANQITRFILSAPLAPVHPGK